MQLLNSSQTFSDEQTCIKEEPLAIAKLKSTAWFDLKISANGLNSRKFQVFYATLLCHHRNLPKSLLMNKQILKNNFWL